MRKWLLDVHWLGLLVVMCVAGACGKDASGGSVPTCAVTAPERHKPDTSGYYTFAALPSGACASDAASCILPVYGPCWADPEYVGHPVNVYGCSCKAGAWECNVQSGRASICPFMDGGADDGGKDLGGEASPATTVSCGISPSRLCCPAQWQIGGDCAGLVENNDGPSGPNSCYTECAGSGPGGDAGGQGYATAWTCVNGKVASNSGSLFRCTPGQ
jgi:hypothetical protein